MNQNDHKYLKNSIFIIDSLNLMFEYEKYLIAFIIFDNKKLFSCHLISIISKIKKEIQL